MTTIGVTTALVTGGGSGIGAASARELAVRGARVAVTDIDLAAAREVAGKIRAEGGIAEAWRLDVSDEANWTSVVGEVSAGLGVVTVLHSNAADMRAIRADLAITDLDVTTWDRVMTVNVRGAMLACKHTLPGMVAAGGGSIVFTSSVAAMTAGTVRAAYGTSKGALVSFMRTIVHAYGPAGVRCNCVAPGYVATPGAQQTNDPAAFARRASSVPLRRLAQPAEIAKVVAFLASADASYVSGAYLVVDGGLTSVMPGSIEA